MAQSAVRAVTQCFSPFLVVEGRVQAARHAPIVGARESCAAFWETLRIVSADCELIEVIVSADCCYMLQRRPQAAAIKHRFCRGQAWLSWCDRRAGSVVHQ